MEGLDLYQRVIFDHNKNPRNYERLEDHSHSCDGKNPLCGDTVTVFVKIEDGAIENISFTGDGCAIFKSSASIMTSALKGKTINEAEDIFEGFIGLTRGENPENNGGAKLPGKLSVFKGVSEYPSRIKCATLSWHALKCAIKNEELVSTE